MEDFACASEMATCQECTDLKLGNNSVKNEMNNKNFGLWHKAPFKGDTGGFTKC